MIKIIIICFILSIIIFSIIKVIFYIYKSIELIKIVKKTSIYVNEIYLGRITLSGLIFYCPEFYCEKFGDKKPFLVIDKGELKYD